MGATSTTIDSQVLIALIATIGGVVTTLLTVKYKPKIMKRHAPTNKKDRMETIFDGYEKLILQQQTEIERKGALVGTLEGIVTSLENELANTKELLTKTRVELDETKEQNLKLQAQLSNMRTEYSDNSKSV